MFTKPDIAIERVSVAMGMQVGAALNATYHPDVQRNNSVQCMVMFVSACVLMAMAMLMSVSVSDYLEQVSFDLNGHASASVNDSCIFASLFFNFQGFLTQERCAS